MRNEKDSFGEVSIDINALYGIHSVRAKNNFPDITRFSKDWYMAMGVVKTACYHVADKFFNEVRKNYADQKIPLRIIDSHILNFLIQASVEVGEGQYYENFIVPAISGGAGTSINMNINEIICNRALIKAGYHPGQYNIIDPIEDANVFQSTNDVVPTALKVAVIKLLNQLEDAINHLRLEIENLEKKHFHSLRIGYTQMQEAVPSSFARLFSNYNDALSRDWWRVSKCFERIKTVNLGGSAIGTGITIPRYFIMNVVQELQKITGLPLTRADNLTDNTSNLDSFVEIHAILKAHAVNLEKMVNDIRLLSSDINGMKEIELPGKQTGSSIMPGKVNPVIPEFVISICHKVYANDLLISSLCSQGCLELNAYLPAIGDALLNSLNMLIECNNTLKNNVIDGLKVYPDRALKKLLFSPSVTTALVPVIGYNKSAELAVYMKEKHCDIYTANHFFNYIEKQKLENLLKAENLLNQGFRIQDMII